MKFGQWTPPVFDTVSQFFSEMAADLRSENCETMSKTGGVQIGLDTACQKSGGVRTPWTLKDLRLWWGGTDNITTPCALA